MIRSMSNAQIEAAEVARHGVGFDKNPWESETGLRRSQFAGGEYVGPSWRFNPRPECIPSPDPSPWLGPWGHRYEQPFADEYEWSPRPWGSFTPDPEFVRSEVNPILSAFRDDELGDLNNLIRELGIPSLFPTFISAEYKEQVESAKKVLTPLRDVMEAGK